MWNWNKIRPVFSIMTTNNGTNKYGAKFYSILFMYFISGQVPIRGGKASRDMSYIEHDIIEWNVIKAAFK